MNVSKNKYYGIMLSIIDIAIFYICLILIVKVRFSVNATLDIFWLHLITFSPLILLNVFLLFVNNLYETTFRPKDDQLLILLGRIQLFMLFFGIFYFYVAPLGITPKTNLVLFWISSSFFVYLVHNYINKHIVLEKTNVLFLHQNNHSELLKEKINNDTKYGIKIFFYPTTADCKYLNEFLNQNNIKKIIFWDSQSLKNEIFKMSPKNIKFQSFEDFHEQTFKTIFVDAINLDCFIASLSSNKWSANNVAFRFFDIILASFFLILSAPFWIFIILLIKITSPGPVFYLSTRYGKIGKKIVLYKFRTMQKDARNQGPAWTLPKDSRITTLGKFLRKFHIDEWPQFVNIIKGDISFVGPRPEEYELAQMFEKEVPFYTLRSIVTPGLTGWAQINMPNTHSVDEAKEKLKFDLFYIKNCSIWLNFYIIIKTLRIPFV